MSATPHRARADRRAGAALAELAVALVVLWMLFAAIVEVGRMMMVAQTLQLAARSAARQLALDDSLPAEVSFDEALTRAEVFDPGWLVLDLDRLATCGALAPDSETETGIDRFARTHLPLLNQQLRPVMMYEEVPADADPEGVRRRLLRYPGALLTSSATRSDPACMSGYTVAVPALADEAGADEQRVRWLPVVESPGAAEGADRFPVSGGSIAAVRINYPHQALLWTAAYEPQQPGGDAAAGNLGKRVRVKPIAETNPTRRGGELITARDAYGGRFGIGEQIVLGERVRPYRRVLRGEAIFPREVTGL